MIFHPRFARLARYATRDEVRTNMKHTAVHVSSCPSCHATVKWVRNARMVLRAADGPSAPAGAWEPIRARLEEGDVVLVPTAHVRGSDVRRGAVRGRRIAVAASLVLAASAAAAVVPGPVRHWLERSITALATPERMRSDSDGVAATDEARRTTLIVPAANGGVAVDIDGGDPGLEVRIRTTDAAEVTVEASGSAAAARFHSGTGRLSITGAGAGEIVVLLPRVLDRATIGVDGTPYVIKNGDELLVLAPLADTTGSEIVLRPARVPSETGRSR